MPPETIEPLKRVTIAVLSDMGISCPVPKRDDTVTLFPAAFWYTTKIFEPDMPLPWPRATHAMDVGAEI
jgi:hypothetical protein